MPKTSREHAEGAIERSRRIYQGERKGSDVDSLAAAVRGMA